MSYWQKVPSITGPSSEGMATPLANVEYKRMYETLGGKPVHSTLAFHWARLVELLYAAEKTRELSRDKEVTSKDIRNKPGEPGEGVGIVEAPRGTLIHHYVVDEEGLAEKVNLIVATVNNAPAICMLFSTPLVLKLARDSHTSSSRMEL